VKGSSHGLNVREGAMKGHNEEEENRNFLVSEPSNGGRCGTEEQGDAEAARYSKVWPCCRKIGMGVHHLILLPNSYRVGADTKERLQFRKEGRRQNLEAVKSAYEQEEEAHQKKVAGTLAFFGSGTFRATRKMNIVQGRRRCRRGKKFQGGIGVIPEGFLFQGKCFRDEPPKERRKWNRREAPELGRRRGGRGMVWYVKGGMKARGVQLVSTDGPMVWGDRRRDRTLLLWGVSGNSGAENHIP